MTVALVVVPVGHGPEGGENLPVATQEVFKRYWKAGSDALGLRWIPLFETGIPLDVADRRAVCEELRALKTWVAESGLSDVIRDRIDRLITKLLDVEDDPDVDVFIG